MSFDLVLQKALFNFSQKLDFFIRFSNVFTSTKSIRFKKQIKRFKKQIKKLMKRIINPWKKSSI